MSLTNTESKIVMLLYLYSDGLLFLQDKYVKLKNNRLN